MIGEWYRGGSSRAYAQASEASRVLPICKMYRRPICKMYRFGFGRHRLIAETSHV
jgi:hypothetical protein